jgi:hypothetical protein
MVGQFGRDYAWGIFVQGAKKNIVAAGPETRTGVVGWRWGGGSAEKARLVTGNGKEGTGGLVSFSTRRGMGRWDGDGMKQRKEPGESVTEVVGIVSIE